MRYLRRKRTLIILLAFLACSVLLRAAPEIDLGISRLFFDGQSFAPDPRWQLLLHEGLNYFLCASLGIVLAIYAVNRLRHRNIANIDGRKVLYLLLVLGVGAGLIVNVGLKEHFGRARPRSVAEFNGGQRFTPAFVVSRECRTNCSFSSGDAAGGFFAIALAMALTRRRAWHAAAIAFGTIISLGRIVSGAHFFSDTVVSFFVMLIVADVLYYYVVLTPADRRKGVAVGDVTRPD